MTQYAYPTSDVNNGGAWTTEPLYNKIDEEPYSDSDLVQSPASAADKAFTVGLGSLTDPTVHTGHVLRIRALVGTSGTFKFELLQGATVIHDSGELSLTTSFAEYSFTLTAGEAANITDYAALRVRVTAVTTYATKYQQVSWVRLEVPDVAAIDLVPAEGYQIQASDSPVLTQEHNLVTAEGVQVQVSDSPVLSTFIRGQITFADLLLLPEAKRLVICEHKPAIEVETRPWGTTGETLWTNAGSTFNRGDFTATNAFFWCSLDLSAYAGTDVGSTPYSILLTDAAGKTASGFLGAAGAGETLESTGGPLNDGELLTNPTFDTDTTGWSALDSTLASIDGGQSGKCLEETQTGGATPGFRQFPTVITLSLLRGSLYVKLGTSGVPGFRLSDDFLGIYYVINDATSSWVQSSGYMTPLAGGTSFSIRNWGPSSGTFLSDEVSLKRVLDPPSTGVHIVSAYNGTTRAWANIESGFNPNTITTAVICGGVGIGSHYTPMTDGEIIEVAENGAAYDEVFTVEECNATASTFFMDLANQRLYLHTSNGDIPSHQTAGVYDFCLLAYFIIGFADRVDANGRDPVFEPEIEMLLDGGFEDWTSATELAKWTDTHAGASAIAREESA